MLPGDPRPEWRIPLHSNPLTLLPIVAQQMAHLYRDDAMMPPGMVAPYQIELDDGELIYAPVDSNECIRAGGPTAKRQTLPGFK